MIHARVDVTLAYHPKAHRAGAAMATWAWALVYTREQELDGFVPSEALRLSWVGEKQAKKDMARLCEVELASLDPERDGWVLARYSAKNETKAEIDSRRKETRERVAKYRSSPPPKAPDPEGVNGVRNALHPPGCNAVVPGSGSGSGSDLESRSREPDSGPRATKAHNDAPPGLAQPVALVAISANAPTWWADACATVASTVAPVDEPAARWLEYSAARERKGWATGQRDAVGWLSQVVRRERRDGKVSPMRGPGGGPRGDRQGLGGWTPPVRTGTDDDPFGGDS